MSLTRRRVIALMGLAFPAASSARIFGLNAAPNLSAGPFQASRQSLAAYRVPEWFHDAKFGIWAHWGPQSAAEAGDWYARQMYIQGHEQYEYHLKHFGHPSKFGFKDVIQTWKGDKFDPDYLVGLYKKAGAKYFVSMGVHHDNFDLWNSKHNRWNAVNMGIKKDVVGLFRQAALKHGLRFGVSDHLWISYKWFATSHYSDKEGPNAGVPYDGADPKFANLYHDYTELKQTPPVKLEWDESWIPESWKQHWLLRVKDLIDQYEPDYVYSDGGIQFEQLGLEAVAHLYNQSSKKHGGRVEAIYTSKHPEDCKTGTCLLDRERGVLDEIWPDPWQTDTCVGEWHYKRDLEYKTPKTIIDMLVDIVSKNGNLMLNFPLPNSGMLDDGELKILSAITDWMNVNGEAIFATRPWKISGQTAPPKSSAQDAMFNEKNRKAFTAEDVRFTTKGQTLYAFVMGWPEKQAIIAPLATGSKHAPGKIEKVELVGYKGKLHWTREESGLKIELPEQKPSDHAVAFKISGNGLV
jgi:alpha-L-fucosidase